MFGTSAVSAACSPVAVGEPFAREAVREREELASEISSLVARIVRSVVGEHGMIDRWCVVVVYNLIM